MTNGKVGQAGCTVGGMGVALTTAFHVVAVARWLKYGIFQFVQTKHVCSVIAVPTCVLPKHQMLFSIFVTVLTLCFPTFLHVINICICHDYMI